uniref:Uncharacterized protein n=1 Tax=Meloidogyne floridensis TaxID=298350 RepID=A0A915NFX7_9BILA
MKSSKGKEIVGSSSHNIPPFHAPPQKVISFYNKLLEKIEEARIHSLSNTDRENMENYIHNRFEEFRVSKNLNSFKDFFRPWNALFFYKNNDVEQIIKFAKNNIKSLTPSAITNVYKECIKITIVERNIFILWHLFGFARSLIRSFILYHDEDKYYDELLFKRVLLNNSKPKEKIEIFKYMEAYDIFEFKAKFLMDKLEFTGFYNEEIKFKYNNKKFCKRLN